MRFVSDHTRTKAPFCLDDLIKQVRLNSAAISQPAVKRADTPMVIKQSDHWLINLLRPVIRGGDSTDRTHTAYNVYLVR